MVYMPVKTCRSNARKLTGYGHNMHGSRCVEHMDSSIFYISKSLKTLKFSFFRNKIWTFYFSVEHKKTTEEIVRVKKEKDAVTATLAKRNDQLIDAVKRAREAIKVLQPVAVSCFMISNSHHMSHMIWVIFRSKKKC